MTNTTEIRSDLLDILDEAASRIRVAIWMFPEIREMGENPEMAGYDWAVARNVMDDVVATLESASPGGAR